jgi:FkbM family methyltransferase
MITRILRNSVKLVPWSFRSRVKKLPVAARVQRFITDRLLRGRSFLHTIDAGPARGLKMWITLPEDKQLWTGTYESAFAAVLRRFVRPGDICVDVGGYHGFFSGVLALAGASAVHTFEPLPANVTHIRSLIAANPGLPISLHRMAVGAEVGDTDFIVMPEASMGKLSLSSFQPERRGPEIIRVRVETIDHLVETGIVPVPNVMKIDVEGAEMQVLRGAERVLRTRRPPLFVEIHSHQLAHECATLLTTFGYHVRVLEAGLPPDLKADPEVSHFVAL